MRVPIRIRLLIVSFFQLTCMYSQHAFQFEQTHLTSSYQASLSLPTFTLECWLMRTGEGESVNTGRGGMDAIPLLSKGMGNISHSTSLNYFLGIRKEDGILVFDAEFASNISLSYLNHPVVGFHPLEYNCWYHVAVTYDQTILRIFLNGVLETAMEIGDLPSSEDKSALVIGGMAVSPDLIAGKFVGNIDELRIWNYARTQSQIIESMNREISVNEAGLVICAGFNEGAGTEIPCIGNITNLNWSGTGGGWTDGSPFNAILPDLNEKPALFSIGLISDPQYCDCDPNGAKTYRSALYKVPEAIDSMNKFQVDFVVNLGDMIDRYFNSYDSVYQFYENLAMPWYNTLGNHEFEELSDAQLPSVLEQNRMPTFYHGFTFKNWRFLFLDGTELASYSRKLHPDLASEGDSVFMAAQDKVNNVPWNGGIGKAQRQWLRDQLDEAFAEEQPVFVFCHFPLCPDTIYLNLWNNEDIMALMEDYPNVIAYINGHYHYGNYAFRNRIHYVNQAGMLLTSETNSFTILEAYSDKLIFKGFGLNPDRVLSWNNPFQTSTTSRTYDSQETLPLLIYPNPVSGVLYIKVNQPISRESIALHLTDMNGRKLDAIKSFSIVDAYSGIIEVTLKTNIHAGVYIMRISQSYESDVFGKIIVH